jgi:hypothetical protein
LLQRRLLEDNDLRLLLLLLQPLHLGLLLQLLHLGHGLLDNYRLQHSLNDGCCSAAQ